MGSIMWEKYGDKPSMTKLLPPEQNEPAHAAEEGSLHNITLLMVELQTGTR